nr:hypothetical protein [Tanacetum cinerariifolium]
MAGFKYKQKTQGLNHGKAKKNNMKNGTVAVQNIAVGSSVERVGSVKVAGRGGLQAWRETVEQLNSVLNVGVTGENKASRVLLAIAPLVPFPYIFDTFAVSPLVVHL